MTAEQFINESQDYYGNYNPTQKKYVYQWLKKRSEKALGYIFAECLKTVEAKYRQPPCIADLERCYKEVREHRVELMPPPPQPLLEEQAMPREEALNLLGGLMKKLTEKVVK